MKHVNHYVDLAIDHLARSEKTDYIGESISQLEHALQCAFFAEQSGHSDEVILASLFHDIGHFAITIDQFKMEDLGNIHHEWIGAKLVYDMGFSKQIALLIAYHVDAKRYLAGKKESYFQQLSAASKKTLAFQGGQMSALETNEFENHRFYKEILQVRINDEKGKKVGLQVPDLNHYRDKIENHIRQNIDMKLRFNDECALKEYIDEVWVEKVRLFLES